jgi:hypothetical protein
MANYAILDSNNIVKNVIVYDRDDPDSEWILVDGSNEEVNKAVVGSKYSHELKTFSGLKIYDSWIFEEETNSWVAPIPKPTDHDEYVWDEISQKWVDMRPVFLEITDEVVDIQYEVGDRRIVDTGSTKNYEVWDGQSWNDAGEFWSNLSE